MGEAAHTSPSVETSEKAPRDEVFVRRVLAGEREAYAHLVERYSPIVERFLATRGLRGADLDDATQMRDRQRFKLLDQHHGTPRVDRLLRTCTKRVGLSDACRTEARNGSLKPPFSWGVVSPPMVSHLRPIVTRSPDLTSAIMHNFLGISRKRCRNHRV